VRVIHARGIFRRTALTLVATIAALLCAAGAALVYQTYRNTLAATQSLQANEALRVRESVASLLGEIERNLNAIASIPWSAPGLTVDDRATEYRRAMSILPAILEITLVDAAARELLFVSRSQSVRANGGVIVEFDLVGRATKTGPAYSPVRFESGKALPYIVFAFPDRGSSAQVSLAKISLQSLSDELAKIVSSAGGLAFVVDGEGKLVAHSNRLSVLRPAAYQSDEIVRTAVSEAVTRADAAGTGAHAFEGKEMWASWQALKAPRWVFFVEQEKSTLLKPVWDAIKLSLGLLGLGLLSALGVSYWLARRMTRPVVALSKSVEQFAAGNLSKRSEIHSHDEIETVSNSFNAMAEELEALTNNLEQKIAEKTNQLETEFTKRESQSKEIVKLEERARIMRDFHDGVGGHLVSLLGAAKRDALDARQIEQMVNDALVDFRIAIDSLSPDETDMTTALASLRFRLLPRLKAAGLASNWAIDALPDKLGFSREAIFHVQRIMAEAITNVVKHASASRVDVRVRLEAGAGESGALTIEVADDGVGISSGLSDLTEPRRGRGLSNIRQRAGLIGGKVAWVPTSEGGQGTTLRLVVPAKVEAEVAA
jgi:signal transduction histidine kinase